MFHLDLNMPMLEYCKTVIEKVSFDRDLMKKELAKSLTWLEGEDKNRIMGWCRRRFNFPVKSLENP